MPSVTANVSCGVQESFRVQQVVGMFDLPPDKRSGESFSVEIPGLEEPWTIGAIVGPSGSGKTTIARAAFGAALYHAGHWSSDAAIIDGFGELPIKQITEMLTAVGLSSPPSWLRPHRVLSGGEKFRCELARALLTGASRTDGATTQDEPVQPANEPTPAGPLGSRENCDITVERNEAGVAPLVVLDEFTSVVDRVVAKIGSAAVSKAIRRGRIDRRLVVVSCHYDILEWLEPDWFADMATCTLKRGRLRRPRITLEIIRCRHKAWRLFARHHYLSGSLSTGADCYLALWQDRPVAFCAVLPLFGYKGRRRISRIVTLPDYQGLGIGVRLMEYASQLKKDAGMRVNITASHPAIINYCRRSPRWLAVDVSKLGHITRRRNAAGRPYRSSAGRSVVSFEYMGPGTEASP